jgi:hypothetical protein
MSALGQKRTYAMQKSMSALHPIATAKADSCTRSCPLYPPKADIARVSARLVRQIDCRSLQIEDINLQLHRGRIDSVV